MRTARQAAFAAVFLVAAGLFAASAGAESYPVEDFGTLPLLEDPLRSPTGMHVAARINVEGKPVVGIVNLQNREQGMKLFNKAAQKAGKPIEYVEFEGTGHQIETTADRIKFPAAVEAFLAKHNPAGGAK